MATFIGAVALALVSAAVGFFARSREFNRDQRLTAYGDFANAFLKTAHAGADLLSAYMSLGDSLHRERSDEVKPLWQQWRDCQSEFDRAATRLRLVASRPVLAMTTELEDYLERNVLAVPPFTLGQPDTATWGDEAKVGPAHVNRVAGIKAKAFAENARRRRRGWL